MKKLLLGLLVWITAIGFAFGAVNINTATKEQLDSLKGIGPTKAQAIIDYRTKHGPFKSVDDLEKVPGIGPATLKEIRSDVTVTGATTPAKAKKDDTKGSARAEEKATKKSEEKKKSDEKPAPKKDETKGATKAEDKPAPKKDDVKGVTKPEDKPAAKTTDTKSEKK